MKNYNYLELFDYSDTKKVKQAIVGAIIISVIFIMFVFGITYTINSQKNFWKEQRIEINE